MIIVLPTMRLLSSFFAIALALCFTGKAYAEKAAEAEPTNEVPAKSLSPSKVVVIPVRTEISEPALYLFRRGLRKAIDEQADTIVLDMDTPGGRLDVTFDMLEAMDKFHGKIVTFVNQQALSAGALISAGSQEIYFAPKAIIGAAAPVNSGGENLSTTMHSKIISVLKARVRAISDGKGYRGEVVSAMIDADFELKIGDKMIKPKGQLLSLNAKEAMEMYGNPPLPLLGTGIANNMDDLLTKLHGKGNYTVETLEATWSEKLAEYITSSASVLIAIALLCLFIEFKTPGFGVFGITGIVFLGIVFFGHYMAGLSGYEPAIFCLLGVALVALEAFIFPGTLIPAITGVVLIMGSLVWTMLNLWPDEIGKITPESLQGPLTSVLASVVGAVVLFLLLLRFLPKGGLWGGMVLNTTIGGEITASKPLNSNGGNTPQANEIIGQKGRAVTALFPSGQVEIDGKRYEAKIAVGHADVGAQVIVTKVSQFGLTVEEIS